MECLWTAKFLSVNKSPQKFLCVNKSPLKVFVCSAQICAGRLFSHGSSNFSHFMWLLNFSTFTTSPAGLAIVASHWPSKGGELHTTKPLCLYIFFGCIFSAQLWGGRGAGWGTDTRKILKVFSIGLTWLKAFPIVCRTEAGVGFMWTGEPTSCVRGSGFYHGALRKQFWLKKRAVLTQKKILYIRTEIIDNMLNPN